MKVYSPGGPGPGARDLMAMGFHSGTQTNITQTEYPGQGVWKTRTANSKRPFSLANSE